MEVIGIGQLRGDTRNYIQRVEAGETFRVLQRGRVIGRLASTDEQREALTPVPLAEFRARVGFFVNRVAAGETITVAYNGRTVATIRPLRAVQPPKPRRLPAAARSAV